MSVKAKFKCEANKDVSITPDSPCRQISMSAVIAYDEAGNRKDENESWSKWTPSGQLNMNVTNPDAFNQFKEGKDYYLTFEEVPEVTTTTEPVTATTETAPEDNVAEDSAREEKAEG